MIDSVILWAFWLGLRPHPQQRTLLYSTKVSQGTGAAAHTGSGRAQGGGGGGLWRQSASTEHKFLDGTPDLPRPLRCRSITAPNGGRWWGRPLFFVRFVSGGVASYAVMRPPCRCVVGHAGAQKPPLGRGPPPPGRGCPLGRPWPPSRAIALLREAPTQSSETGTVQGIRRHNLPRERRGQ